MPAEAVMKLRDEMAENSKHPYIQLVGAYLIQYVQAHPEAADKILAKDKTIKGSLSAMRDEARKHQVDSCGVLSDEQGFAVVLKYFGINGKPTTPAVVADPIVEPSRPTPSKRGIAFDINLDDLLGTPQKRS